ncbi:alpha/beta hydrolase [Paracoccus aminophilus]|uniref:Phospholipase/carboxylesterase n=1 Tax=Paracoccus aminophilus JCM 7686 TaxID=1367847 RepID=S5YXH3_PARAH|nr:alpha/beta hydrolase [Paracoccus aminophilus]AGT09916.1 phospholipase/carboxylesterase [Paracoccus aminophilus JCM 7686]
MSYEFAQTSGQDGAPLIFTFHGTGGDEHQFHGLAQKLWPGAHVISPRGDVSEYGAARYFRRKAEGVYDMEDLARRTETMAKFMAEETQRSGAPRVIALGYSNGANILASVLLTHPEIVTDAILLHPLIPWQPAPQPGLQGRRVLVTAGRHDPICPPAETERLNRYLGEQGVALTEFWTNGGHGIEREEIAAVADFLK